MPESGNDGIRFYLGDRQDCERMPGRAPWKPFADETTGFLAALSAALREKEGTRRMPDVASFAFWCRRANLELMRQEYGSGRVRRLGRGVSLHFASSNIPVLFAFSAAAGLLAGNTVILRLPRRETEQERAVVSAMERLTGTDFPGMRGRIVFCRYGHERETTEWLSSLCDIRVIWGTDASVREIRRIPLPPRAVEIPFASRGSAAVLSAAEALRADRPDLLARDFYNDTYLNDQNACSSPRMVCWLGEEDEIRAARERFWDALYGLLRERRYEVPASLAVKKLDAALQLAAEYEGVEIRRHGNAIVRAGVPEFHREMWDHTVPGGFFIESGGASFECLRELLTPYCQTVCVYGVEPGDLADRIAGWRARGADRIVPVGRALDFSLTWDGFDLIGMMSRTISC